MDPVTTSLVTAVASGLTVEAVKETYYTVKQAIKEKLGISKTIEALEAEPDSKERQNELAKELSAKNAAANQEIAALAQQLIEAIKATATGRSTASKYSIAAQGAQVAVIGDGALIEGGIHYHYGGATKDDTSQNRAVSGEATDWQADEDDSVLMYILHLSDLHFGTDADAILWSNQLAIDLRQELDCNRIDAMIISGDVANLAVEAEYKAAKIFVEKTCKRFAIERSHLVIVPGNHDLNWKLSKKGYILKDIDDLEESIVEGEYIPVSKDVVRLKQADLYRKRFSSFSRFYKGVKGVSYPLEDGKQGILYHLKDHNLLILGLNSAWQVDHYFTKRAGICNTALAAALDEIMQHPDYSECLKFAVWHHPISSSFEDRIIDHGFMELLAQSGFCVCFHGHLHKTISELVRHDRSAGGRKIEIVGAGTFGAPVKEWTQGYPLQYNLLKIYQKQIKVQTRRREEINGAWKPDARWTQGPGKPPLDYYMIDLPQNLKKKSP